MAKQEYTATVELADAEFDVRFLSQKTRDEIADRNTRKVAGQVIGELHLPKFQADMADALIAGWRKVTPETAMRLGYEDFDELPVNDAGEIPYTAPTARKLYRFALRDRFAAELDTTSRGILEGLARAKKFVSGSSATSAEPSN